MFVLAFCWLLILCLMFWFSGFDVLVCFLVLGSLVWFLLCFVLLRFFVFWVWCVGVGVLRCGLWFVVGFLVYFVETTGVRFPEGLV